MTQQYWLTPQLQPQTQQSEPQQSSALPMIIIAVSFGALGVLAGFHAGATRSDIVLTDLEQRANEQAQLYASCVAWDETQKNKVEQFYQDYFGGATDDSN